MKIHTFKAVKDRYLGKRGTAQREDYECRLQRELVSEAIREAREARNLSQEALRQLVQNLYLAKLIVTILLTLPLLI